MTILRAIHFPETTLASQDVMGQILLFDTISYITPTPSEEEIDPLCPPYDPAPLGEDATRFGQLLAELKGNETAFYQGQMSRVALEYLETRDDNSVRDIINGVHGEKSKSRTAAQEKDFEQLWQARLLLKLAEIMRREEQEVHESLQRIKEAQENMLGDLKGEEEFGELFHTLKNNLPNQMSVRVESLIKAWGRLFAAGSEKFSVLHCHTPEAAEPFMEISEAITGKRPVRLVRLPLPHCAASPQEFLEKKATWQEDNSSWLSKLQTALHTASRQGLDGVPLAEFTKLAAQWTSQIEQTDLWPEHPSQKKCGPPALEIYLLGDGMQTLTAKLCNLKPKAENQEDHYTLLVFVSCRPNTCN